MTAFVVAGMEATSATAEGDAIGPSVRSDEGCVLRKRTPAHTQRKRAVRNPLIFASCFGV
jgi:hypothetical protein